MKKLLWTSAMALAAVACLTACDDTSSSSYEIPTYKSDTTLPDTCSMEVAKVDTAYYACFENKWVEVTDSATVEQLKEGLDEEEIKAKLEELETLLVKPANNTPKPTSSSAQSEVEGSDDEEDSSSSSEEEEEYSSSSKKKKNKDKDEDDSGSGSGEATEKKCGDVTYDPKTQVCGDDDKILSKCGKSGYDPETQVCGDDDKILSKCGESGYDPETQVCGDGDKVLSKCGESGYDPEIQICGFGDKVLTICGEDAYDPETQICGAGDKVLSKCGTSGYDPATQYCKNGTTPTNLPKCGTATNAPLYNPEKQLCDTRGNGDIYKMYTLGTKTWMAENLRYKPAKGITYCQDETKADCGTYGRLYTWTTAVGMTSTCSETSECSLSSGNVQGVCPTGWHIPSGSELETLASYSGSVLFDVNGFNAQKSGYYSTYRDEITSVGSYAGLWSTKQYGENGYRVMMSISSVTQNVNTNPKKTGNPVRCVKD